ncbi:MAG TPA: VWA domain-containing protein [Pyrinomonadaceae bacterium]|jgi:Ca-activated chloride channel family protein|nr:VWA domain-containing protein [Pyrinomonadaceae bacterium]
MPEILANKNRTRHKRFRQTLLLALVALGGMFIFARAQEQQQRPRRVGSGVTKSPAAQSPQPSAEGEEVDDGDIVRVETQLVSVPAVVTDGTGRPIAGLSAENFVLYEDGRPQQIANFGTTEAPFEVALLLDTSGSTRADVTLIRGAAKAFIDSLRAGDRVAIVAYNTSQYDREKLATVDVLARLTNNRKALGEALEDVGASNGTPFYDSLERIVAEVFRDPPNDDVRGRRAVVALTDGVDSASNSDYGAARSRILRAGLACYFIQVNTEDFVEDRLMEDCHSSGTLRLSRRQLERYRRVFAPRIDDSHFEDFCGMGPFERMQISRDLYALARREMDDLARASGGKTFPVSNLRDARAAFARVANEIGTQYSLGYYPSNKAHDGGFRAIRVEVKGVKGSAQIRAREGYYAPKS